MRYNKFDFRQILKKYKNKNVKKENKRFENLDGCKVDMQKYKKEIDINKIEIMKKPFFGKCEFS